MHYRSAFPLPIQRQVEGERVMRFFIKFALPVLAASLVMPAIAQEADPQTRQQIETVHAKWLEGLNKGDVDAVSAAYTPSTVQIDAFGRMIGVSAEFVQGLHRKGTTLSMPIEGVRALKGGRTAIAYGTFTSKHADLTVPPG
jgi:hypothetical protein